MPPVVAEFLEHIVDELSYLDRNAQNITKQGFNQLLPEFRRILADERNRS